MPRSARSNPTLDWVLTQAEPGRRAFGRAAVAEIVATIALITQWALVASVVAVLMTARPAVNSWGLLAGAVVAGVVRWLARAWAASTAATGERTVTEALRAHVASRIVSAHTRATERDASAAADAILDAPPVIARYLGGMLPQRRAAVPSTLLILAAVTVVHWPVGVLLALCTALLPLNLMLAGHATVAAGERQLAASRRLSAIIRETVAGMPALRSLRAVSRRRRTLARSSERLGEATGKVLAFAFISGAVMDVAVTFAIAVSATYTGLVLLGYVALPGAPALTLAGALFVLLLCPAYFVPAQRAARGFHDRDDALIAARVLGEVGAGKHDRVAPQEATDTAQTGSAPAPATALATPGAPAVTLTDVTVQGPAVTVLDSIFFVAEPGEWTAVGGPSGAGKTTLLQVAAGRITPSAGAVTWDGGTQAPAYGWLGAESILLETTLLENVTLRENGVSDEAAREAMHLAGLDAVIARLPDGIHTSLRAGRGERGRALSAGERRRVALARLIAANRPLWILDEPTAHLDAATERTVLDTLRATSRGRTVIVATHSAAVREAADRAYELRGGRIDAVQEVGRA